MDIVIIGTGNTATVLGKKLKVAGHRILQVFGRNRAKAESLANSLGSASASDVDSIHQNAELYLIAVSDNAVENLARSLALKNKMVAHTAASVPLTVLKGNAKHYGVFYPLQSLNKGISYLPEIPVLVDGSDEETVQLLKTLAATISEKVFVADDAMRVKMHLAAVMTNNFTNHLFVMVEKYCREEGLHFSLLLPLLQETVSRLNNLSPYQAQTGPAVRNDTLTVEKHRKLLEKKPDLKKFYDLFTESIQQHRT